jgi:hypothetical protein
MIVLRAIPFSFNILWQYIIVFPIMVLGLTGLSLLAVIVAFQLFFRSGGSQTGAFIVGMLFVALLAAIYTFPMLIGMRLGLTTRGHKPAGNFWSLIIPASGYGLLVGLMTALITAVGMILYLRSISLSFADISVLFENATFDYMLRYALSDIPLLIRVSIIGWVLFTAFYAAMLVPLASVAIGRDPSGNPHTPFAGFGAGFVPLLALVLIGFTLSEISVPIIQFIANLVGQGDRFAGIMLVIELMEDDQIPLQWNWEIGTVLIIMLIFWLWTISLLCAGATLVYLDRFDTHKAERAEKMKVDRLAPEEARALWQQRMPGYTAP